MTPIFSKLTGCILNIATVASLGTWDAGHLEEGARAWTADVRDVWVLAKTALAGTAADGITVIAATGAGASAFWIRQSQGDMYWSYQGTWYVDPATGADTADGAVPARALQTVAELSRRLVQVRQNSNFTVNLLGNIPVTDSFVDRRQIVGGAATKTLNGSTIFFTGQRTVTGTFTAAAGTKNTAPNSAADTAQAEAVRAAGAWVAADVGKLIVDNAGNTAWILTEKDGIQTARVTDWLTSGGFWQATPAVEGTSSLVSVPTWRAPVITGSQAVGTSSGLGLAIYFQNFEFDNYSGSQAVGGVYNNGATVTLWVAKISDNGDVLATAPTFFANGSFGLAIFQGVMVQHKDSANSYAFYYAGAAQSPGLQLQWLWGNGGRRVKVILGTSPNQVQGLCIQAGWVECGNLKAEVPAATHNIGANSDGSWLGVYQDFGSLNVTTLGAIQVNNCGRLRIDGSIYGTAVGAASIADINGLASSNGGLMWLAGSMLNPGGGATPQLCFNLVPKGAGTEFYLDGIATTTGSITAANAGAVLPISIVCTTWAQYIGAVANGWARNMRNPANNGGYYKGA